LAAVCLSFSARADSQSTITASLAKYGITVSKVVPVPIAGMFEVTTETGILYTNSDATYFIYGQLFDAKSKDLVNLTEISRGKLNLELLAKAKIDKELIVYPAKDEKYAITVFTDTSCGYCAKMHNEIAKYNDLGITLRFLAFPRSGLNSPNMNEMAAVWCSADKNKALDAVLAGKNLPNSGEGCLSLIEKHMGLGQQIGITGTPTIILENGSMLGGYLPPKLLLQRLKQIPNS
ncbi:MAG: bifunctional protein-disulfide isomerase/oxidoreductase DsbC, partial [Vibrionaceae bacterium]